MRVFRKPHEQASEHAEGVHKVTAIGAAALEGVREDILAGIPVPARC